MLNLKRGFEVISCNKVKQSTKYPIKFIDCVHEDWFCHPKRSSGAACCPLAFYSSVNNGLYIISKNLEAFQTTKIKKLFGSYFLHIRIVEAVSSFL
jgi:hypothetical protein